LGCVDKVDLCNNEKHDNLVAKHLVEAHKDKSARIPSQHKDGTEAPSTRLS